MGTPNSLLSRYVIRYRTAIVNTVVIGGRIVEILPDSFPTCRFRTFLNLACLVSWFLLVSGGCDTNDSGFDFPRNIEDTYDDPNPHSGPILPTYDEVLFEVGNYRFVIRPDGVLKQAEWNSEPSQPDSTVQTIYSGGLWMTGTQDGRLRANITWVHGATSNFIPTKLFGESFSLYHFRASDVNGDIGNWPDSLGAPVLESFFPAVFGDHIAMSPSKTGSIPDRTYYDSGFDDVLVVQTVFGFDHFRLADVFFVRYDITNRSDHDLESVRLGIHTDTDLQYGQRGRVSTCVGIVGYSSNQTGFDLPHKMTYTYPTQYSSSINDACLGVTTGYLILETATEDGFTIEPGSHRIYRRNTGQEWYFSESAFKNVEDLQMAMEGLSTRGEPMINPVTGETTKWAFTGNPVDGTGWIDYPNDVRSLLSTEAFSLESGEHVAMTVAWITARDETLALALNEMRALADILIANPRIWRDPN